MQPKRKIQSISGIRDFSVCSIERIVLVLMYDVIKLYDVGIQAPLYCIKLDSSPRLIKLSPNGKLIIVFESNYNISIYDTSTGALLQKIVGTPTITKYFKISKDSQKLIFASSQMLCLWSIR